MNKLLKKSVAALLSIVVILSTVPTTAIAATNTSWGEEYSVSKEDRVIVSVEDWRNTPIGQYPIDVTSDEWKDLKYDEAVAACDMPEEYAKELSTQDLVKYAVKYPFVIDILFYDSIEDGIAHLEENSTVFRELFSRKDCNQKLIKEYINMSCDYTTLEKTYDMVKSRYDDKLFFEGYFGVNYDNLSNNDAERVVEEVGRKYQKQPKKMKKFSKTGEFFEGISEKLGYVPEEAVPDSIINDIILEDSANELSFTSNGNIYYDNAGTKYYKGTQKIKGKNLECFQYVSGDLTTDEISYLNKTIGTYYKTFVFISSATKKYNCHSYAWYSTSASNKLWINHPKDVYNNTKYYEKGTKYKSGSRILFFKNNVLQHSAIMVSSTRCKSKLGAYGAYNTTIAEMKAFYSADKTVIYNCK